ncbi:MAG: hypothetical protein GY772_15210, partial [bacterium]|nr:hypothetical protein [bacterium]
MPEPLASEWLPEHLILLWPSPFPSSFPKQGEPGSWDALQETLAELGCTVRLRGRFTQQRRSRPFFLHIRGPVGMTEAVALRYVLPAAESVGTNTRLARALLKEGITLFDVDEEAEGSEGEVQHELAKRAAALTRHPGDCEPRPDEVDQQEVIEVVTSDEEAEAEPPSWAEAAPTTAAAAAPAAEAEAAAAEPKPAPEAEAAAAAPAAEAAAMEVEREAAHRGPCLGHVWAMTGPCRDHV